MENSVLVVRVPERAEIDQRKMRDYIVESLRMGVLVIGQGVSYAVENMEDLGGVALFGGRAFLPDAEQSATDCDEEPVPESGTEEQAAEKLLREKNITQISVETEEKMRIRDRMELYRKTNGLGCWKALEKACRSKRISEHVIRQIYLGEITVSVEDWRIIDKGLTKLGASIPNGEGAADG